VFRAVTAGCSKAKRQLDQDRWASAGPVPRSRAERLREAGRRLADELAAERRGNEAYEHYRATGRASDGRRFGKPPKPHVPPASPQGEINLTDPDSRLMKATKSYLQGYNAQAAVNEEPDRARRGDHRRDDRTSRGWNRWSRPRYTSSNRQA